MFGDPRGICCSMGHADAKAAEGAEGTAKASSGRLLPAFGRAARAVVWVGTSPNVALYRLEKSPMCQKPSASAAAFTVRPDNPVV